VARGWHRWLRRGVLVGVLAAAAFAPGQVSGAPASGAPAAGCAPSRCSRAGLVRWAHPLPGAWSATSDMLGTVPAQPATGQAYAAVGQTVVAVGFGMIVYAYSARTGDPLWVTGLTGFPAGSRIVSVRAWPAAVTVGVARGQPLSGGGGKQSTVLLSAGKGRQLRRYPAAPFGGAIAGTSQSTVVLGPAAVTSYQNATGKVIWSRATGRASQGWRSDGGHLYVAVAGGDPLSAGPVTALREISLHSGAERVIRPLGSPFQGRLAAVLRGVALFSGPAGISAYSSSTGALLWQRRDAVPESADVIRGAFYLTTSSGNLVGVQPSSGRVLARLPGAEESTSSGATGVYGVRGGVALGVDLGPGGRAWGYDVASQRVIWTTRTLPWPHFFVDLSGIGGSTSPSSGTVLLAACPQRVAGSTRGFCQDPELVLIDR
jgi:outer membrane protein assembly factor BamB